LLSIQVIGLFISGIESILIVNKAAVIAYELKILIRSIPKEGVIGL